MPRAALLDGLEEAERAHVVRPVGGGRWAFSHALVREAVYDDLPTLRRARLHAALADALVHSGGAPAEAAYHAYEAAALEGPERAIALAREAAAEALAGLDYEAAAAHLARALQALDLDPAPDPVRRAELLCARGEALARAADPEALDAFGRRSSAGARRRRRRRAGPGGARRDPGSASSSATVDRDQVALLQEALAATRDESLRASLLARLAIETYYVGRPDHRSALADEAVAIARRLGDPAALTAALSAQRLSRWDPDHLAERRAISEELVAVAVAAGDGVAELQGRNWRAVDLWEAADIPGFEAELERHAALADALRLATFRWYAPMWRGCLAALRGDHAAARPLIAEARAIGARADDRNVELCAVMIELQIALQEHDFAYYDLDFVAERIANSPAGPRPAVRARGRSPNWAGPRRRAPTSTGSPRTGSRACRSTSTGSRRSAR